MLFTKPKDDITYEDVKTFCEYHAEGVHVEYKQQITKNIPKVIASFANTYGGICLIGVEANQVDNRITAIPGIPKGKGIEEGIQRSALNGIHPSVFPEIILVDVPNTENVVVVIHVDASIHAPHAIDNATKIYFRVGSVSEPYELADTDRIEYMFKRREGAEQTLQRVIAQCEAITKYGHDSTAAYGTVSIHPTFIYRPLTSASKIYDTFLDNTIKRISGGVALLAGAYKKQHTLINEYGIVYHSDYIHVSDQKVNYQGVAGILIFALKQARHLYQTCGYLGNLQVNVEVTNVHDIALMLPESIFRRPTYKSTHCLENNIILATQCFATELTNKDSCISVFMELSRQLFWAFDLSDKYSESQKLLTLIEGWYSQL